MTKPKRVRVNMRIPYNLDKFARKFAKHKNISRTQLYVDLLQKLKEVYEWEAHQPSSTQNSS